MTRQQLARRSPFKTITLPLINYIAFPSLTDPIWGCIRRGEGQRPIHRLCMARFLLLFQWYAVLLLQDAVLTLCNPDGILLGLWVRLSRLLSRLVRDAAVTILHDDVYADQEALRTVSLRLLWPVLRDLWLDLQQDCRYQQNRIMRGFPDRPGLATTHREIRIRSEV